MMSRYRKADNCGDVPYPDQSGRFLTDGQVVQDDKSNDWSKLLGLEYVVLVELEDEEPSISASQEADEATVEPSDKEEGHASGIPDDGGTAEGVDTPKAGGAGS